MDARSNKTASHRPKWPLQSPTLRVHRVAMPVIIHPLCVLSHKTAAVTSVTGSATEKPFPPVASVFQCVRKSEQLLTSNSAVRRALLDKHGPDVTSLRVRGDNFGIHALI